MNIRSALKEAIARLRDGHVPSHTLAAELLLMHVTEESRAWLYAHPEDTLDAQKADHYFALVAQRVTGTPTQYLTGKQEFWGMEFLVAPGVLIPRPETEHVVEVALERLGPPNWDDERPRGAGLRVADVGTGSGCLAIALAKELPGAEIFATDISTTALAIARRNAERLGVAAHIQFTECNLLDSFLVSALASRPTPLVFHLIVSNPPYVGRKEMDLLPREVREHEPHEALFAGEVGSELYVPLIEQAHSLLGGGGILVLELGYNSLPHIYSLMDQPDQWTDLRITHDLAGIPRVISALRT